MCISLGLSNTLLFMFTRHSFIQRRGREIAKQKSFGRQVRITVNVAQVTDYPVEEAQWIRGSKCADRQDNLASASRTRPSSHGPGVGAGENSWRLSDGEPTSTALVFAYEGDDASWSSIDEIRSADFRDIADSSLYSQTNSSRLV